jgi:hypothetical protein
LQGKVTLNGKEKLSEDEIDMLLTFEEENSRRGNFTRVFPLASNLQYFEKYFETRHYKNSLVSAYILATDEIRQSLTKRYRRICYQDV